MSDTDFILDDLTKVFDSNLENMSLHELSEFEELLWRVQTKTDKAFGDMQKRIRKLIIKAVEKENR